MNIIWNIVIEKYVFQYSHKCWKCEENQLAVKRKKRRTENFSPAQQSKMYVLIGYSVCVSLRYYLSTSARSLLSHHIQSQIYTENSFATPTSPLNHNNRILHLSYKWVWKRCFSYKMLLLLTTTIDTFVLFSVILYFFLLFWCCHTF